MNILDLVRVASNLGKSGENGADVNGDGVVNILDLVRVAGALGDVAAAPASDPQALAMLTAADVGGVVGSSANARPDGCNVAAWRSFLGATSGGADAERDGAITKLSEPVQS